MRDIENYADRYVVQGFESYKVQYRRRKILEIIKKYQPKKILEIGCGKDPLFKYIEDIPFTIIEPAREFYEEAMSKITFFCKENIVLYHAFFEDIVDKLFPEYDMIICAGLLHEVEHPDHFINNIVKVCNKNTIVHINVPNANSIHRLLGKEMGILKYVHDMSENNIVLQQNSVFDKNSLNKIVMDNGLEVFEDGAIFMKPFSHIQMYKMMQYGILDEVVLDGLYMLGEHIPEFGSEIYVNCKIKVAEK